MCRKGKSYIVSRWFRGFTDTHNRRDKISCRIILLESLRFLWKQRSTLFTEVFHFCKTAKSGIVKTTCGSSPQSVSLLTLANCEDTEGNNKFVLLFLTCFPVYPRTTGPRAVRQGCRQGRINICKTDHPTALWDHIQTFHRKSTVREPWTTPKTLTNQLRRFIKSS